METKLAMQYFDTALGVALLALSLGDKETALSVLRELTDNDEVIDALYDADQREEDQREEEYYDHDL